MTSQLKHYQLCHSFIRGATSSHLNSLESIQATGLPLDTVNLLGMHIIPPLTINAGILFTYPQRDGGLSQPPARLSREWVLNPGPLTGRSDALPTELSWPIRRCNMTFWLHNTTGISTSIMWCQWHHQWHHCISLSRLSKWGATLIVADITWCQLYQKGHCIP